MGRYVRLPSLYVNPNDSQTQAGFEALARKNGGATLSRSAEPTHDHPPTTETVSPPGVMKYLSRFSLPPLSSVKALGLPRLREEEDELASSRRGFSTGAPASLEGIGDGLITVLPGAFFNASVLERLSATGLLGGVLVLEEEGGTADADTVVGDGGDRDGAGAGGGGPVSSLPASAGAGGGTVSNPDVKTPQVNPSHRAAACCVVHLF